MCWLLSVFPCVGVWLNWIPCEARILNVGPTINVPQEREHFIRLPICWLSVFPCVGVWLNWILCQARILNVSPTINVPQEREFSHHMNETKWFIIL